MIMYDIYIVFKTPMGLQILFLPIENKDSTECSSNISKWTKSILFSVNTLWTLSLSTFVSSIENKSMYIDAKAMGAMYTSLIAYIFR